MGICHQDTTLIYDFNKSGVFTIHWGEPDVYFHHETFKISFIFKNIC